MRAIMCWKREDANLIRERRAREFSEANVHKQFVAVLVYKCTRCCCCARAAGVDA